MRNLYIFQDDDQPSLPELNNLDNTMRKLDMLTTIVNSGSHRPSMNGCVLKPVPLVKKDVGVDADIVQMNTRYVSNVTIGLRMKKTTNNRIMPYTIPERNRTKSENSDGCTVDSKDVPYNIQDTWMEHSSSYISVLDPKVGHTFTRMKKPCLKKAHSLENIRAENIEASQPSHEMEFVSSRIQKLKVME